MRRGHRRVPRGRRRVRRHVELHGPVLAARRDGAGAQGARQQAAPSRAARLGRQLRRQAGGVPVRRADGPRVAQGGRAGQVGRGPARTPERRDVGDRAPHHHRSGLRCRRSRARAALRPGRRGRRLPACARTRDLLPDARRADRRVRHRASRGPQSRGRDEQDADRPRARLRRTAGVLRARAAVRSHRRRVEDRSRRTAPAQLRAARPVPVPCRGRCGARLGRLRTTDRDGRRCSGGSGPARTTAGLARRRQALRHRPRRDRRAVDLQHGLHQRGAHARAAREGRPEERRHRERDGRHRPARRRQRDDRVGARGPGAHDGVRAGRRRRVRHQARAGRRQRRVRQREGRVVGRGRQLQQPLRRCGRRCGPSRGDTAARQGRGVRRAAVRRRRSTTSASSTDRSSGAITVNRSRVSPRARTGRPR